MHKRAISIPAELGDAVDALVRSGASPSFSAFVAEAVRDRLNRDAALAAFRAHTGGPPGGEDQRRAERLFGIAPTPPEDAAPVAPKGSGSRRQAS